MKRIERYQTRDGQLHKDAHEARRHAENCYGLALSNLAHKLLRAEKYTAMQHAIEANLGLFLELKELQNDCTIPPPDDTAQE